MISSRERRHGHVRVYSLRWRPESVFTTHQRGASPRRYVSKLEKSPSWLALLYLLLLDARSSHRTFSDPLDPFFSYLRVMATPPPTFSGRRRRPASARLKSLLGWAYG